MYTVKELAALAGVTVRTLHHYDRIGVLRPTSRTDAGYRQYGESDVLRLQQVLFYRELGFALNDIRRILEDPAFDTVVALREHRKALEARSRDINRLVQTIDRTLEKLTMHDETVTDAELYEGFAPEEVEAMKREVDAKYDPKVVAESRRRVREMTKGEWAAMKQEGDAVCRELAARIGEDPASAEVQALVARHHAWIEKFYSCGAQMYRGLGEMYVADPRFRGYYESYGEGLAEFLRAGMDVYAERLGD